jgi:hypothetical protein
MCCGNHHPSKTSDAMKKELIITSSADIRALVPDIGLFSLKRGKVNVQFGHFSTEENKQLEVEINRHYSACGCEQGRMTGIFTLLGYVLLLLTGVISIHELGIGRTVLYYFICSFVTMLGGKVYGLWRARHALKRMAESPAFNPL